MFVILLKEALISFVGKLILHVFIMMPWPLVCHAGALPLSPLPELLAWRAAFRTELPSVNQQFIQPVILPSLSSSRLALVIPRISCLVACQRLSTLASLASWNKSKELGSLFLLGAEHWKMIVCWCQQRFCWRKRSLPPHATRLWCFISRLVCVWWQFTSHSFWTGCSLWKGGERYPLPPLQIQKSQIFEISMPLLG